ncbi:MAG: hypothetical protein F4181_10790 [Proteobacteria bacterium]|nr:hypothetical protein [Pseudomonadota bacterium]
MLEQIELTHTFQTYTNLAVSELEGIDMRITAAVGTPAGVMNLRLCGTQMLKYLTSGRDILGPPVDAVARTGVLAASERTLPANQVVAEAVAEVLDQRQRSAKGKALRCLPPFAHRSRTDSKPLCATGLLGYLYICGLKAGFSNEM